MGSKTLEGLVALTLGFCIAAYWLIRVFDSHRAERPVYFFLFLSTGGWVCVALLLNNDIPSHAFWVIRIINLLVLLGMVYGLARVHHFEEWWRNRR
jgi:peptidoglycan/LPS O-acetylase OafA/YrhL